MTAHRTLPADVEAWMKRLDYTLDDAAAALGVDRQTVWRWKSGATTPPPFLWRAMRDVEREERAS